MTLDWRDKFIFLIDKRKLKEDGEWAACKLLAPLLSEIGGMQRQPWSANYLLGIYHQNKGMQHPSPAFTMAVEKLYKPPRIRKDKPRLYTPFDTKDEIEFISSKLPAHRRREILLAAAERE